MVFGGAAPFRVSFYSPSKWVTWVLIGAQASGPTVVVQVQGSGLIQQTEGMYTPEHSGSRDNGIT